MTNDVNFENRVKLETGTRYLTSKKKPARVGVDPDVYTSIQYKTNVNVRVIIHVLRSVLDRKINRTLSVDHTHASVA